MCMHVETYFKPKTFSSRYCYFRLSIRLVHPHRALNTTTTIILFLIQVQCMQSHSPNLFTLRSHRTTGGNGDSKGAGKYPLRNKAANKALSTGWEREAHWGIYMIVIIFRLERASSERGHQKIHCRQHHLSLILTLLPISTDPASFEFYHDRILFFVIIIMTVDLICSAYNVNGMRRLEQLLYGKEVQMDNVRR